MGEPMKLNFKEWFNETVATGPYIPGSVKKDKLQGTLQGAGGGLKSVEGEPIKWKPKKRKKK